MLESKLVIAAVSWAGGILAAVLVQQILNRRRMLSYFVQHQYLGSTAQDSTFGNVEIKWNGSPVPNLYLSTVELTNESSRDLEKIKILAYTADTDLLSEFPQLVGTTQHIRYSPEFEDFITVPTGELPSETQLKDYRRRREYLIPVMNRGQVVRFQYLNSSNTSNQPSIWLESVHPGVTLKFKIQKPLVYGVPQPLAAFAGVISSIVFAVLLATYNQYVWLTAFGCLLYGLVAQLPGAFIVRAIRKFRQWITG